MEPVKISVKDGVVETLRHLGISEPKTAAEMMTLYLAHQLDNLSEEKNAASLSRELDRWIEAVRNQPKRSDDFLDEMTSRQ